MSEYFDPSLVPLTLLLWPAARSAALLAAVSVGLGARSAARRAEARRIIRLLTRFPLSRSS